MNFSEAQNTIEMYSQKLDKVSKELLGVRAEYLAALKDLQEKEQKARLQTEELPITRAKEKIKTMVYDEKSHETEIDFLLKSKIEEKDLLVESINLFKTALRLKELEAKFDNKIT